MATAQAPWQATVTLGGLRLAYLDYGNTTAPPAVLVHATGFHKELWGPVARALAPRFHVLAFDQRGHGDSDKPAGGYHWLTFVDDLTGFLDALKLRDVLAVGHSAGGTAVILAAAARPALIGRAVLVEPAVSLPSAKPQGAEWDRSTAARTRKRRESFESPEACFQSFRDRPPFKGWTDAALWTYARDGTRAGPDGRVHLKCPPEIEAQIVEAQLYEKDPSINPWLALGRMRCPTLFIQAGSKGAPPAPLAERMGQALRVQYEQVPGAGHFVPMEQPDAVIGLIQRFLNAP